MPKYISENAELMKEWDWERNTDLNPEHLLNNSNKKAWWICAKCGNKWETAIYNRAGRDHTGCPYCARQKIMPVYNDLQTEYPKIAKEWHPTKNGNLTPSMVMGGSSKKHGGYVLLDMHTNNLLHNALLVMVLAHIV